MKSSLRLVAVALVAVAVTFGVVVAAGAPAGAHGGPGNLALVSFEPGTGQPAGGADYAIAVTLTFAGDGDPVDDATVTLSGTSDSGSRLTPVALTPGGNGRFSGSVTLPAPGRWNLTVVSVEPPAQLALEPVTVTAGGGGSSTTTATTSSDGAATTEGRVSALDGATTTATTTGAKVAAAPTSSRSSGGGGSDVPWPLLVGAALVFGGLLMLGVRQYFTTRARSPEGDAPSEGSGQV